MEQIKFLIDLFLHLDEYLAGIITQYGAWTYGLLFVVGRLPREDEMVRGVYINRAGDNLPDSQPLPDTAGLEVVLRITKLTLQVRLFNDSRRRTRKETHGK